ncbi:high-affinity potassium uptake transporter [Scheffersomyces amazonensis]|uniref:high-affinity potassium uptake transporter n=1 Tax=Scheffersomyces amazonensis TaxID=1078765 RepID=UPI00315C78DE
MDRIRHTINDINMRRLELQLGFRIREKINSITSVVYPYVIILIPSFRIAHYVYIISLTFIGSVIIFPIKNIKYIDALFFTAGASTQAGLNTIDTNLLDLYQQITIYTLTFFATPIFIHSSLLFIRLYYFERHFDNIKQISKQNFQMRRSATLAAQRTASIMLDPTQRNTVNNQGLGFSESQHRHNPVPEIYVNNKDQTNHIDVNDKEVADTNSSPQSSSSHHDQGGELVHVSEPSDTDEDPHHQTYRPQDEAADTNDQVKFGNLPQPPPKRKRDIDPSQMYMSIAIRHRHGRDQDDEDVDDDDDDELIIRPPNEIENSDSSKPIFIKKIKPKHLLRPRPRRRMSSSSTKKWKLKSRLKKTLSNTNTTNMHYLTPSKHQRYEDDEEEFDDDRSIDSENESSRRHSRVIDDDEDGEGDDENDEDEDEDEEDEEDDSAVVDDDDDDEEDQHINKAQSHLVVPSLDQTGGKKFSKRSNTLDVSSPTTDRKSSFIKSPTFERMMKMKRTKDARHKKRLNRVKTPYSLFGTGDTTTARPTRTSTGSYDSSNDSSDFDEESAYYNGELDGSSLSKVMSTNYLSWVPTVGRNSTFVKLTQAQKEELGGVEYRAIKLLIKILIFYYVGFHIISIAFFLGFILIMKSYGGGVREQGISPTWWAFFTAQSTFNDLGITLTNNSMSNFSRSPYVLLIASFFIVIGNTGFPIFLRFIIWILFKFAKPLSLYKESLGFLLDHPRRCFTLLFPSVPTWWLLFILVVLNSVDLVLFIVLDLNNPYLNQIPVGYRILDGFFQAISTRTAGFSVVNLAELHPAVQVSYMIMMYISVLPLAISIRRTNVYEEQSLGVYLKDEVNNVQEDLEKTPTTFIGAHLRNQLSFDLWFIFLGLFVICIAEGGKLNNGNINFTVFTILFEIISAYGTVGLSLGYPGINASLSAEFSTLSKLVIIAMMIRGRHRGLPYALDRAIMLPDADMHRRDEVQEHHAIRRQATMERANTWATSASGNDANLLSRVITNTGNMLRRRSSGASTMSPNYRRHSFGSGYQQRHHPHHHHHHHHQQQQQQPLQQVHTNTPHYTVESDVELDHLVS